MSCYFLFFCLAAPSLNLNVLHVGHRAHRVEVFGWSVRNDGWEFMLALSWNQKVVARVLLLWIWACQQRVACGAIILWVEDSGKRGAFVQYEVL